MSHSDPVVLNKLLAEKTKALNDLEAAMLEIKEQLVGVAELIKSKDLEISTKDGELGQLRKEYEEIKAEMKNKDGALFRAKAKVEVLEEGLSSAKRTAIVSKKKLEEIQKEDEKIREELQRVKRERDELERKFNDLKVESESSLKEIKANKKLVDDLNAAKKEEIENLEKKIRERDDSIAVLKERLSKYEGDLEQLKEAGKAYYEGRDAIIEMYNEQIKGALSSLMIVLPTITDLKAIDLSSLKPQVNVKICTNIDLSISEHVDLYNELKDIDNLEWRIFDREDRYGLSVDRGVIFMGTNSKIQPFGLLTEDEDAINLFMNNIIHECWTLGRRMK